MYGSEKIYILIREDLHDIYIMIIMLIISRINYYNVQSTKNDG